MPEGELSHGVLIQGYGTQDLGHGHHGVAYVPPRHHACGTGRARAGMAGCGLVRHSFHAYLLSELGSVSDGFFKGPWAGRDKKNCDHTTCSPKTRLTTAPPCSGTPSRRLSVTPR